MPLSMVLTRQWTPSAFAEGAAGMCYPRGGDWSFVGFFRAGQLIRAAGL